MNQINLIGNLTRDPEVKTHQESMLTSFTVAVNRKYGSNEADFFQVSTWGKLAEICEKHLRKGSRVWVSGALHLNLQEDKTGNQKMWVNVNAKEIEFLSFGKEEPVRKNSIAREEIPEEFCGGKDYCDITMKKEA